MNRKGLLDLLRRITFIIEMVLTFVLAFGVIISIKDLAWYFPTIWNTPAVASYILVKDFLGHVLLLVVGVELMLMLINHSMVAILELIMFVIARKMLIYADTMLDLLLGTLSIGIVFLVFRYLMPQIAYAHEEDEEEYIYDADVTLAQIRMDTGVLLDSSKEQTIGELINFEAKEHGIAVLPGAQLDIAGLEVTVLDMDEGEVNTIKIVRRTM